MAVRTAETASSSGTCQTPNPSCGIAAPVFRAIVGTVVTKKSPSLAVSWKGPRPERASGRGRFDRRWGGPSCVALFVGPYASVPDDDEIVPGIRSGLLSGTFDDEARVGDHPEVVVAGLAL